MSFFLYQLLKSQPPTWTPDTRCSLPRSIWNQAAWLLSCTWTTIISITWLYHELYTYMIINEAESEKLFGPLFSFEGVRSHFVFWRCDPLAVTWWALCPLPWPQSGATPAANRGRQDTTFSFKSHKSDTNLVSLQLKSFELRLFWLIDKYLRSNQFLPITTLPELFRGICRPFWK